MCILSCEGTHFEGHYSRARIDNGAHFSLPISPNVFQGCFRTKPRNPVDIWPRVNCHQFRFTTHVTHYCSPLNVVGHNERVLRPASSDPKHLHHREYIP